MNKYKEFSERRKQEQADGTLPNWYSTAGYQMIREKKYIDEDETVLDRYKCIAETLSLHLPVHLREEYKDKFFNLLWNGYLGAATPVYSNIGKPDKGMPISCAGSIIADTVDSFYKSAHEVAMLSKNGFGTSAYLGDIRPRGSKISNGSKSDGVVPVMELIFNTAAHISQGSTRRGSVACYLPISHPDFDEVIHWLENNSDGSNFGWCISDEDIAKLNSNDPEMIRRYQEVMYLRMLGIGYIFLTDNVNKQNPQVYKDNNLKVNHSNLCTEISLFNNSDDFTFTCCLSSLNLLHWDVIKSDPEIIFDSIVFLDCVNSEFIKQSKDIPGLEKARRFAQWSRPIGLGVMGLSSYMQSKNIEFDALEGHYLNTEIFKTIREYADKANVWLAEVLDEPELMKGTGLRCSHLLSIPPTLSNAQISGGVSNGIEPFFANVYTQESAAGEMRRANPILVNLLKSKGKWKKEIIDSIAQKAGSVQHLDFLSDKEKAVFKTAFEVDQMAIINMANARQKYIDQAQSINLFFSANAEEEYISAVHQHAINSSHIKSLYYVRSSAGVNARTSLSESGCSNCEG